MEEIKKNPDNPVTIGTNTATDKKTAQEQAQEFIQDMLAGQPQKKLNFWEKLAARRMAKELRRLGMLTNGQKGFTEETYEAVIQMLKEM